MSDKTSDNQNEMRHLFAVDLSDKETLTIGKIVALWGSLEYEVFCQTLVSLDPTSPDELPKEMNNLQFTKVLDLWKLHVADKAADNRKDVLQSVYKSICHYHKFRNDIVHGMWDWSQGKPDEITVLRVRKKEIHTTRFTAADLRSLASELGEINFRLRYPGGVEEYTEAAAAEGSYMSRLGLCLMTSNPLAYDLLPQGIAELLKKQSDD